jgi:enoyl-CoA hydratase/carnithine racemase
MQEPVLYDLTEHIVTITLNRPERANAATIEMGEQLQTMILRAERDPQARVIVLTGAGQAFCAGDDVEGAWQDGRMTDILRELADVRPPMTPEVRTILDCAKPVIAAVNGIAVGSGMDMALACDVIIAGQTARFGQSYVRMGLMADVLGYWRLPQLVGPSRAAELLLSGEVIDAAKAERIGLVTDVFAPDELMQAVVKLAGRIASNPPVAVRYVKEGLRRAAGRPATELPELATFVGNGLAKLFATEDHEEAANAFLQKRKPVFSGR